LSDIGALVRIFHGTFTRPAHHGASIHVAGADFAQQFLGAADAQAIANVTWSLAQLDQHQRQQQQQYQRRQLDNANNVMLERLRNLVLNDLKHETVAKMVLGGKTQCDTSLVWACATTLKVLPSLVACRRRRRRRRSCYYWTRSARMAPGLVAQETPGAHLFCHPR
jgi:hypothetical protein